MHKAAFVLILVAIGALACGNIDYSGKGNDVPTQGEISVGVDYGDSFLMTEWLSLFRMDYPKAVISPRYLCEVNLLRQLESGELSFVLMNRNLTVEEVQALEQKDIKVRSVMVAKTSIALVANLQNPSDRISIQELKEILGGKKNTWNGSEVQVVFDAGCGSNYSYFKNKWFSKDSMSSSLTEKKTSGAVLEFVARNKGSIGFVSLNWIADRTDSASVALVKKVKVLAVENPEKNGFFLPFQSQIAAKEYPFIQEVFMHEQQGYTGLAKGFVAWVSSQPGQILVKKSGLIPARDSGRTIQLSEE